jgi:uncharacterized protein YbaP (TraB family)
MKRALRALVFGLAAISMSSGCASVHRLAERSRLSQHPIHEQRMTNQPAPGYIPTGVWRVKGDRNTLYLAGTCHVVSEDQVPFPSTFYAAYNDAEVVYVEVDSLSWSTQWMLARAVPGITRWIFVHASEFSHSKGRTLEDDLSPETIQKLRSAYGADFARYRHMTPLGLLFWSEFTNGDGKDATGVDDLFTALAHKQFKSIHSLDDSSAVKLAMPTMDAILAGYKRELAKRGPDTVIREKILDADDEDADWRRGDLAAGEKVHTEIAELSPELYQTLLPQRNRKWMPKIDRALRGNRNAVVLVGAAHLAGKEGLLQLLREAGYKPEQMYGIDRPCVAPLR